MEAEISQNIIDECAKYIASCREEAARRIVGQREVIDGILTAVISGGHILLEGVPGLAKTLAVRTFAEMSGLEFKRIQFTPDLLPADVTGTLIYEQSNGRFLVHKGPVFANVVLADEINRAPAKVQSALLEAMAERQVTIGDNSYRLAQPFFVLATENPIEQEGTYSLPEAELDRFLMKIVVDYPSAEEEAKIVRSNGHAIDVPVRKVFPIEAINRCREAVEKISCDDKIYNYIVSIVLATRPSKEKRRERARNDIERYIAFGVSPRAGIALLRCAKAAALFNGRGFVLPEDVQSVCKGVLRHRLVLNYEAASDGITPDDLIEKIVSLMPLP